MLCLRPEVTSLELLYLALPIETLISMEYYIETVTMYNTVEKCVFCPTELTICLCKLILLTKVKWQKGRIFKPVNYKMCGLRKRREWV